MFHRFKIALLLFYITCYTHVYTQGRRMSIKTFFHMLITSNFDLQESDVALKKVRLINFILLLAIPINALFIYANCMSDHMMFALFNILIVLVMSFTFFHLRRSKQHIHSASHLTILGMFLIHVPALLQGGIANSGFVWFFLFPLFSIFLTGRDAGRKWILLLFLFIIATFIFQKYLSLPYDPIYLIFLLAALTVETLYVLFSHNIQTRYEAELAHKNYALEQLTHHLETAVKKQLDTIRSKETLLLQQSKMASVGEMMSFIAHQWKQPISTINVMVQNLQLSQALNVDNIEGLSEQTHHNILEQTALMITTMHDFLHFARPSSEALFKSEHALHMLEQLVSVDFQNQNIDLIFKGLETPLSLYGKENEFVHALMNIVNNAKDALLEKNIEDPSIIVDTYSQNNKIIITISDNAGGIPEDLLPQIFDAYFSTKLDHGGTGLGLHLSHKIISENMHGHIDVSNTDRGACFTLTLPMHSS